MWLVGVRSDIVGGGLALCPGAVRPETGCLKDEFPDEAPRFVERHKDGPVFLYLAYNAPHAPLQATEKYLSRNSSSRFPKDSTRSR